MRRTRVLLASLVSTAALLIGGTASAGSLPPHAHVDDPVGDAPAAIDITGVDYMINSGYFSTTVAVTDLSTNGKFTVLFIDGYRIDGPTREFAIDVVRASGTVSISMRKRKFVPAATPFAPKKCDFMSAAWVQRDDLLRIDVPASCLGIDGTEQQYDIKTSGILGAKKDKTQLGSLFTEGF